MKKLMIAACTVALAAAVQAANVSWESTSIQALAAADCEGQDKYGMTGFGGQNYSCVKMLVWEFSDANWNSAYENVENIWKAYGTTLTEANATKVGATSTSNLGNIKLVGGDGWTDGQNVNAAILFLHSDTEDYANADFYMANYGKTLASNNTGTLANLGTKINGTGAATAWTQAVPEPTSGLLLLLGVSGLALRRRRA